MSAAFDGTEPVDQPPAPFGQGRDVAPGLHWLRAGLPTRLNHVNVWVLADSDGTALVDCGPDTPQVRAFWGGLDTESLGGTPRRLFGTHGHLDHVGGSGWVTGFFGATLWMSLAEWQAVRLREPDGNEDHEASFLARHGVPPGVSEPSLEARAKARRMVGPQTRSIVRLRQGDEITIGARRWRVMTAGGHADEHVSLYCEDDRILIAGDQILPHITPMIGVFEDQPEADPLSDYLASLDRFDELPDAALVLPSHGVPFRGLRSRIAAIRRHHEDRLAKLEGALAGDRTAFELSRSLFPKAFDGDHGWLALAETLAHLHRLRSLGRVVRDDSQPEIHRFRRS